PMKTLFDPVELLPPALEPKKLLRRPVVLLWPAPAPIKVLLLPVFEVPALTPAKRFDVPALLKMRWPPRLYCVAALSMLAVSAPAVLNPPGTCTVSTLLPSTIVLLVLVLASAPITVA